MPTTFYTLTHDSLFSFLRHCEERSLQGAKSKRSQRQINRVPATKQSSFTNQLTRVFQQLQTLFIANSEQGDCFADSATMNLMTFDTLHKLQLAMTNVGKWVHSLQNVGSDKRKRKLDFVGCILRTTTRLATTKSAYCKRCDGALSAPYTFTARFA